MYHAKATWRMPNLGNGATYEVANASPDELARRVAIKMWLDERVDRSIANAAATVAANETEHLVFGESAEGYWTVEVWSEA